MASNASTKHRGERETYRQRLPKVSQHKPNNRFSLKRISNWKLTFITVTIHKWWFQYTLKVACKTTCSIQTIRLKKKKVTRDPGIFFKLSWIRMEVKQTKACKKCYEAKISQANPSLNCQDNIVRTKKGTPLKWWLLEIWKENCTYFPRLENPVWQRNTIWTCFTCISSLSQKCKVQFIKLSQCKML